MNVKKAAELIFDKLANAKVIGKQNRRRAVGIIEFQLRAFRFANEAATPENAPAYFKGLSKKEKDERERVIKRRSKMKSNDPDAYKSFRTDKGKKTKPSSSTLKLALYVFWQ